MNIIGENSHFTLFIFSNKKGNLLINMYLKIMAETKRTPYQNVGSYISCCFILESFIKMSDIGFLIYKSFGKSANVSHP